MGYYLLRDSFKVLMLFTPESIEVEDIVRVVQDIKGIRNVHHVHIWQLNEEEIHLEAHVDFEQDISLTQFDLKLREVETTVFNNFGINHVTIQPEFGKEDSKDIIVQD